MNNKRILTVLLSVILLFSMTNTAFSSVSIMTESDGETVKISGTIPSGEENIPVAIDVFAPNKNYSDLQTVLENNGEVTTVIANRFQVKSRENGSFEHTIRIVDDPSVEGDALSGSYTVIVWPMDSEESEKITFLFTNINDMSENFLAIKGKTSYEEVLSVLNENVYGVGVPYAFYETADKTPIAKMVFDYIQNNTFDERNINECVKVMKKAAIISGLTSGDISNAFDYATELSLDTTDIKEFYEKDYAVALYDEISKGFKGENIESFDKFYEKLNDVFLLSVVEKPDGVGNAKEVIDAFSAELKIKATSNLDVYRKVIDVKYNSVDAFVSAYKKVYNGDGGSTGGGGSSGGGGGGGSSSSKGSLGGYQIAPDVIETEEKDAKLPMDIFTDIESVSWAKEAIVYLAEKTIINGKSDGKFCPLDNITREEFVKIVVGAFLSDEEEKQISFADVDNDKWYAPYVKKAYNAGIITGYSDGRFGIGENITREDMVVILHRVAALKGLIEEGERSLAFEDSDKIADYAKQAVAAMAELEIVNGKELGRFAPKDTATRAETAKMVYRLIMK